MFSTLIDPICSRYSRQYLLSTDPLVFCDFIELTVDTPEVDPSSMPSAADCARSWPSKLAPNSTTK